jgi:PKD repeat protein
MLRKMLITLIFFALVSVLFLPACKDDPPVDPPVVFGAGFSATPFQGMMPLAVQFTDETTGTPVSWKWDLQGDGQIDDSVRNPINTYGLPGFYSVTLFVSDASESDTLSKINYVNVTTDELELRYEGWLSASQGAEVTIPVRLGQAATLGAFTLKIFFDNYRMEVKAIDGGSISGIQSIISQATGTVSLAWSSVQPAVIDANGVLIGLRVLIREKMDSTARHMVIGNPVEFTDPNFNLIDGLSLVLPALQTPGQ